ncbi:hypothetical protein VP1G_09339 [Cytospora mali]|uniref:Ataxin-10 homolog n=1 Tax=Cytospora mali TaxID=578113 RepID=A0A194VDX3_CYTMA|nr:hypothetical protein VP1G_09339 [Valsa mali var. pyri (nom. inval.)]
MASGVVADELDPDVRTQRSTSNESIEERCFAAALICLEAHYDNSPPMGPQTNAKVISMVSRTLEKTHASKEVREALSRNVTIWMWLNKIFSAAIPNLTTRSVGPLASLNDPDKGVTPQESTALIIKNYQGLKDDLQVLNKLMHIARNLLVTTEPEVPQDLCATSQFDQMVYQTIILCVNVTSKGYDGEVLDENSRQRLNEITELYKKILVTSLQQAHNWTAKNDRNKMSFWFDVLFDEDAALEDPQDGMGDGTGFRVDVAKTEVLHWLERNSSMCDTARRLVKDCVENRSHKLPGPLKPDSRLAWNWMPPGSVEIRADDANGTDTVNPHWNQEETDKFEQDRRYGRVSKEVDTWWIRARDPNYADWVVPMPSVEFAQKRTENCKENLVNRYAHQYRSDDQDRHGSPQDGVQEPEYTEEGDHQAPEEYGEEYADEMVEDEDVDDDDSYGEGPMTGLLTEVPNILDPKQIEALHMIVKSCILDAAGSGLSRAGENLQKTRCRMFLALDCGKSLLREMLVFIAVWEKDESSLIFQITSQIVEAIHHSALIPYAWSNLRIPKDIVSPAQTILLRLINYMFRARIKNPGEENEEQRQTITLAHYFFSQFRSRIVPECVALMNLQAQIRDNVMDPADFPVDNWDMERAKDGLVQFLDFLTTVSEDVEMRTKLIEWEAAYDLLALLKGLEAGVPKKPLVDVPNRSQNRPVDPSSSTASGQYMANDPPPPPTPHANIRDTPPAHTFPWAGVKGQILQILAALLQPPPGRGSPGNPIVQNQICRHNGIVALLNCCTYDDHNRYARERVQLCLKWLMDGCDDANKFLRNLVHNTPAPSAAPGQTTNLRIDGVAGEVRVQVRPASSEPAMATLNNNGVSGTNTPVPAVPVRATNPPPPSPPAIPSNNNANNAGSSSNGGVRDPRSNMRTYLQALDWAQAQMPPRSRTDELLHDIINLADEAARLALGENAEETEDEDFMYCVMKLTERLKKEGIDINLRDALGVDTDPKLRNLRGKL